MEERRYDTRKIITTPVRLYHSELGRLDGVFNDISEGGAAIKLNSFTDLSTDSDESTLFLRPINLDVLFPVSWLRQTKSKLVVKFLNDIN